MSNPTLPIPVCLQLTCINTTTPATPSKLSTTLNGNFLYSVTFSVPASQSYTNSSGTKSTYTGTSIVAGNWIAGGLTGGCAWRISAVTSSAAAQVRLTLEDVNNFSYSMSATTNTNSFSSLFNTNSATGPINYIYFTVGPDGLPILTPTFRVLPSSLASLPADIMSRFSSINPARQYVTLFQTGFNLQVGSPIWFNTSTNFFEKSTNSNAQYTIGIVTSLGIPTTGNFTIKVFGTYYNDTSALFPTTSLSSLTSSQKGKFLYIDTSNTSASGFTSTPPSSNAIPVWVYLGQDILTNKDTGILYPGYGSNSGSSGSAVITSTATSTLDPWLNANFIAQPPAPTLITQTSLPNDIYVVVNPPPQTTLPILSTPVPVINYVSAGILNNSSSLTTTQLQFPTTSVLTTPLLTKDNASTLSTSSLCIHLSTLTPITTATTYALTSSQSIPMKNYLITTSQLSSSQLYVWYSNNAMGSYPYNVLSVPISYLLPGYPGIFTITSFNSSTNPSTNPSLLVILNPPLADSANNISASTSPLTYKITYTKDNVNSVRQGGAFGSAATYNYSYPANNSVINSTTLSLVNSTNNPIYPDTQYTITGFSATNESNNLTTATLSSTQIITTPGFDLGGASASQYLRGNANNNTLTNQTLVQGKSVAAPNSVVSLLASRDATFQTPNMAFNIQNSYATRGLLASSGTTLVTIVSQLNQDNVANAIGGTSTTIVFNGGIAVNTTVTNTNSTMTATVNDQYTTPQLQGYYQYANVVTSITTPSQLFTTASNNGYSLSIVGTYELINTMDRNIITSIYNSNKFYYDGYTGNSSLTNPLTTASIANAGLKQICGVWVITNQDFRLNVQTSNVSGIGSYFYNQTQIMTYNLSPNTLTAIPETTFNSSNLNGATNITSALTFSQPTLPITIGNTTPYTSSFTINTTIYDAYGNSNNSNTVTISPAPIYDPSVQPLTLNTITGLNAGNVSCGRVYSGTTSIGNEMANPNNSLNNLTNNGTRFIASASAYDNSQVLTSANYANELLYSNGYFQTPGANVNGSLGYGNYTTYYKGTNVQPNYSSIPNTGYRYCTFAWNISANVVNITKVTFTLNDFSANNGFNVTSSHNSISGMIGFTNTTTATASPLLFYYRLEDTTNFNAGNSATNTPWINGNSAATAELPFINANTVNDTKPLTGVYMNAGAGNSNSYNNVNKILTIGGNLATFSATSTQVLYCRIGLPMNTYSYFSNINAVLS